MTPTPDANHGLSRRQLLTASVVLATSMAACSQGSSTPVPSPATVTDLVAADPFYVAHRGGGRNWPEMTSYAYDQAAQLPYVKAIEISVCVSSDNVLVCSHDANTLRMTGANHEIEATDWATLSPLLVSAAETDDPGQPARPLTRLDDVIDAHLSRLVCFVEPKTHATNDPLFERMTAAGQPDRVVWKQPVNSTLFPQAKAAGFGTWGYVLDEPAHLSRLDEFAADPAIDMLGVAVTQSPAIIDRVMRLARANGKQVMMWPVSTTSERSYALSSGARGMMTPDIAHLPLS